MLDVPPEHTGLHPLKAPGVFHRDDGIRSGDHAAEDEAAIKVALVPTEHFQMRFGVFGTRATITPATGLSPRFANPSTVTTPPTKNTAKLSDAPAVTLTSCPEMSTPSDEARTTEYGLAEE